MAATVSSVKASPSRKTIAIPSPVSGKVMPLSSHPLRVYQQKLLGDGVAIMPSGYKLVAPFKCVVLRCDAAFPEIRLKAANGLKMHIAIGEPTERLLGEGMRLLCKRGQIVNAGTTLMEFDLPRLKQHMSHVITAITILNSSKLAGLEHNLHHVRATEDPIFTLLV